MEGNGGERHGGWGERVRRWHRWLGARWGCWRMVVAGDRIREGWPGTRGLTRHGAPCSALDRAPDRSATCSATTKRWLARWPWPYAWNLARRSVARPIHSGKRRRCGVPVELEQVVVSGCSPCDPVPFPRAALRCRCHWRAASRAVAPKGVLTSAVLLSPSPAT
jgi:hypothetical protein